MGNIIDVNDKLKDNLVESLLRIQGGESANKISEEQIKFLVNKFKWLFDIKESSWDLSKLYNMFTENGTDCSIIPHRYDYLFKDKTD